MTFSSARALHTALVDYMRNDNAVRLDSGLAYRLRKAPVVNHECERNRGKIAAELLNARFARSY